MVYRVFVYKRDDFAVESVELFESLKTQLKIKELKSSDLVSKVNGSQFNFKTTNDISTYNGIIGQSRALETVETALQMPQKGFNLYVCGQVGMGKTPYVLSIVNKLAKTKPVCKFDVANE